MSGREGDSAIVARLPVDLVGPGVFPDPPDSDFKSSHIAAAAVSVVMW